MTNLAYGNLTDEMRDGYVRKTYEASRMHLEAMELLEGVLRRIDEKPGVTEGLGSVTWFCGIGGTR